MFHSQDFNATGFIQHPIKNDVVFVDYQLPQPVRQAWAAYAAQVGVLGKLLCLVAQFIAKPLGAGRAVLGNMVNDIVQVGLGNRSPDDVIKIF